MACVPPGFGAKTLVFSGDQSGIAAFENEFDLRIALILIKGVIASDDEGV